MGNIKLSPLGHTWIIDIDGTVVKHNGYKTEGEDTLLPGAESFLKSIPQGDMRIFITSRKEEYRKITEDFFTKNKIAYDYIIFDAPYGERIIVNDKKPSGLNMGLAVNLTRDTGGYPGIEIDKDF